MNTTPNDNATTWRVVAELTTQQPDALDRIGNYVSDVISRRASGQLSEYEALQRIANYAADELDRWAAR